MAHIITGEETVARLREGTLAQLGEATVMGDIAQVPPNSDFSTAALTFSNVTFVSSPLQDESCLRKVNFAGCTFNDVVFDNCALRQVNLTHCQLSNVRFKASTLEEPSWGSEKRPLRRADHPISRWYRERRRTLRIARPHLRTVRFDGSTFDGVDFSRMWLSNIVFKDVDVVKATFRGSVIDRCDFRYAVLANTDFRDAWLEYVDFYRSVWSKNVVIGTTATISKASLNRASLEGVDFTRENLGGVSGEILQQKPQEFKRFLLWVARGDVKRQRAQGLPLSRVEGYTLQSYREASDIFRTLSGVWKNLSGHAQDSAWAYRMSKRLEAKAIKEFLRMSPKDRCTVQKTSPMRDASWSRYFSTRIFDRAFGFGNGITQLLITIVALLAAFAVIYWWAVPAVAGAGKGVLGRSGAALLLSFGQAIGLMPGKITQTLTPGLTIISSIQTLVVGVFVGVFASALRDRLSR